MTSKNTSFLVLQASTHGCTCSLLSPYSSNGTSNVFLKKPCRCEMYPLNYTAKQHKYSPTRSDCFIRLPTTFHAGRRRVLGDVLNFSWILPATTTFILRRRRIRFSTTVPARDLSSCSDRKSPQRRLER